MTSAPYLRRGESAFVFELDALFALTPAMAGAVCAGGWHAYGLLFLSAGICLLFDFLAARLQKRALPDYGVSALVTGAALVLLLPVRAPYWAVPLGAAAAMAAKMLPGGLGKNRLNPAALGCLPALLLLPAVRFAPGLPWGQTDGWAGDFSGVFLLLGTAYLAARGFRRWILTGSYLAACLAVQTACGLGPASLGGGLLSAACCLLADPATTPMTPLGQLLAGLAGGALAGAARGLGQPYPGAVLSVLAVNLLHSAPDRAALRLAPAGGKSGFRGRFRPFMLQSDYKVKKPLDLHTRLE